MESQPGWYTPMLEVRSIEASDGNAVFVVHWGAEDDERWERERRERLRR